MIMVKATSIFLYDLYLLGYYEITFNDFFIQTLCEYVTASVNKYPVAIAALFDARFDGKQINVTVSKEIFASAYVLAQTAIVDSSYASKLFDNIPIDMANEIGEFACGFSTYLIDKMNFISDDKFLGISKYIKQ